MSPADLRRPLLWEALSDPLRLGQVSCLGPHSHPGSPDPALPTWDCHRLETSLSVFSTGLGVAKGQTLYHHCVPSTAQLRLSTVQGLGVYGMNGS